MFSLGLRADIIKVLSKGFRNFFSESVVSNHIDMSKSAQFDTIRFELTVVYGLFYGFEDTWSTNIFS